MIWWKVERKTGETDISVEINLDGIGKNEISTGIGFLDHMLGQMSKHGRIDLFVKYCADLLPLHGPQFHLSPYLKSL